MRGVDRYPRFLLCIGLKFRLPNEFVPVGKRLIVVHHGQRVKLFLHPAMEAAIGFGKAKPCGHSVCVKAACEPHNTHFFRAIRLTRQARTPDSAEREQQAQSRASYRGSQGRRHNS